MNFLDELKLLLLCVFISYVRIRKAGNDVIKILAPFGHSSLCLSTSGKTQPQALLYALPVSNPYCFPNPYYSFIPTIAIAYCFLIWNLFRFFVFIGCYL